LWFLQKNNISTVQFSLCFWHVTCTYSTFYVHYVVHTTYYRSIMFSNVHK
jgi:hypothetical protein